ncbi:MAG TPA: competence/damage-inducible protein A [Phycisphaerae bacterium]|nr:competence/damage-inducible protein A [Phycisphaerae bacterium]
MRAVVLSIGSELVSGLQLDTHAAEIARALGAQGIEVVRHETLDDDAQAIAESLRAAAEEADVVVATGGLGPTPDDRTRDGLAAAMGALLEPHPEAVAMIETWAASRCRAMSEANRRQGLLPRGAEPIANRVGSAPGIRVRLNAAEVFCLPGVPGEMHAMLTEQVLPRLRAQIPPGPNAHRGGVRTVRTFGLPESVVGERLADLMAPGRHPRVATAVHMGTIDVHIHATGPVEEVDRLLATDAAEIKKRLGQVVFGEGETRMEDAVAALLAKRGATVAVAESCTGGLVTARLVNVPGVSDHLLEGVVAYSNASKVRALGVDEGLLAEHGAVSEPVARAMAEGIRARAGADFAVAVTGIAGPGGGTPDKPVGTVWFALADANAVRTFCEVFSGDRAHVRERSATYALNLLRLCLLEEGEVG